MVVPRTRYITTFSYKTCCMSDINQMLSEMATGVSKMVGWGHVVM
jgi:hypothetical protein